MPIWLNNVLKLYLPAATSNFGAIICMYRVCMSVHDVYAYAHAYRVAAINVYIKTHLCVPVCMAFHCLSGKAVILVITVTLTALSAVKLGDLPLGIEVAYTVLPIRHSR